MEQLSEIRLPVSGPVQLVVRAGGQDALLPLTGLWPPEFMQPDRMVSALSSIGKPSGKGGLGMVVFGSSTDEQNFVTLTCDFTVVDGVAFFTHTGTPSGMLIATGARAFVGTASPVEGSLADRRIVGVLTRLSGDTASMPVPGWPNGSGTTKLHLLEQYAPQSWVREVVSRSRGRVRLLTTWAAGGESTTRKRVYHQEILALSPDVVAGSFGIGNDVLNSADPYVTIANVRAMVETFTNRGIICLLCLPPATLNLNATRMNTGQVVKEGLMTLRDENPLVLLSNEFDDTIDPNTGLGKANMFRDGNIHANHRQAILNGTRMWNLLSPLIGGAGLDTRVSSILDTREGDASSRQLTEGFFDATGTAATAFSGSVSGSISGVVDPSITLIQTQAGGGNTITCSLPANAAGYGRDQRIVWACTGNNRVLTVELAGSAAKEFYQYMQAGKTYDVSCGLVIAASGGATYGHDFHVTATTGADSQRSSLIRTLNAADDTDEPLGETLTQEPAIFPPFTMGETPTAAKIVLQIQMLTAGTLTIDLSRPTVRERL